MRPDRPKTDPSDLYLKPGLDRGGKAGPKSIRVTFHAGMRKRQSDRPKNGPRGISTSRREDDNLCNFLAAY
jgi:hypothetical protein